MTLNNIIILIGVGCVIAAVLGGGLKAFSIEVSFIESSTKRISLATVGIFLVVFGIFTTSNVISEETKSTTNSVTKDPQEKTDQKNENTSLPVKETDSKKNDLKVADLKEDDSQFISLYPAASTKYLTPSDLKDFSKWDLKIMRNEIFARHGFIFKTDEMRNYFLRQKWYKPKYFDVNGMLTQIEKDNLSLIKGFENN